MREEQLLDIKETVSVDILETLLINSINFEEEEAESLIDSQDDIKEIDGKEDLVLVKRGKITAYQDVLMSLARMSEKINEDEVEEQIASVFDLGLGGK